MIKKVIIGLSFLFAFPVLALAYEGVSNSNTTPDQVSYTRMKNSKTTTTLRVDFYGNLIPGENGTNDIGTANQAFKKIYVNSIQSSTGIARANELFLDLPAKTDRAVYNGGGALTLSTLLTGGTSYAGTLLTQPSVPRNIVVLASVTVADLYMTSANITATAYIEGFDSVGRATQTYQTVVTTANAAAGIGSIAWSHISSITIVCTSTSAVQVPGNLVLIKIGTGDNIGLANDITSTGDIYHVSEAGTVTTTYTANATYNTINFATDGTGSNDYTVRYIINNVTQLP